MIERFHWSRLAHFLRRLFRVECGVCEGRGMLDDDDARRFPCGQCDGRGWGSVQPAPRPYRRIL